MIKTNRRFPVPFALGSGVLFLIGVGFLKAQEPDVQNAVPEHRQWILDCIEKGNPHSDEEPEDLVLQCEKTARQLFPIRLEEPPPESTP